MKRTHFAHAGRAVVAAALTVTLTNTSGCSPMKARLGKPEAAPAATTVYRLDNGLTVVLREDHFAPVSALQIWVKAGAADERDPEAGVAHVHEHMLFKGTERRAVGEIASEIESAGGRINAWTSWDQTVYHIVVASRHTDTALDVLADAVRHSSFDPVELDRELGVVLEEWKRGQDSPGQRIFKAMFDAAYTVHPYRRPVIGTEESISGLTREKVLSFFKRFYAPNNMVLIAVGDFDSDHLKKQIDALLGDFEPHPIERPERPVEPSQNELRLRTERMQVREAHLSLGFHIPSAHHEDAPVLDMLAFVLGEGESSRLYRRLVIDSQLATSASAYAYTPPDPGMFMVSASLEAADLTKAYAAAIDELARVRDEPVSSEELERARANLEADFVYQAETVQGQARELGYSVVIHGDPDYDRVYLERIRSTTAADLQRVARKYLRSTNLTIVELLPEEAPAALDREQAVRVAAALDREAPANAVAAAAGGNTAASSASGAGTTFAPAGSRAPAPGGPGTAARSDTDTAAGTSGAATHAKSPTAPEASDGRRSPEIESAAGNEPTGAFPQARENRQAARSRARQREGTTAERVVPAGRRSDGAPVLVRLDNGVRLIIAEHHEVPAFTLRAAMLGGLLAETPETNGISNFTADMLSRGTLKRDRETFARDVENIAGNLGGFSGRNSLGISAGFLSEHLEEGLALFLEALREPAFDEQEVEKARREILLAIKNRADNPSRVAFDLAFRTVYPTHPYGMTTVGTEESVSALSADDLRRFYWRALQPDRLVVAVVGDVDPGDIERRLGGELAKLRSVDEPFVLPAAAPTPTEVRHTTFKIDRHQAHVVLGYPSLTVRDPNRFALDVLTNILAGQGGRLFFELRDRQSLAYSVTAFAVNGLARGLLAGYIATDPDNAERAIKGMLSEFDKVRTELVAEEELSRAQRYLIGSREISLQTNGAMAEDMTFNELYGLGYLAGREFSNRIAAVTREDVRRIARDLLDPSIRAEVVVGP